MSVLTFSVLIGLGSFIAGLLGSLTGLGGGVIMIPLLTLVFGVDMHYAMGASLVSVIATSSGSAAAYVCLPPALRLPFWRRSSVWFCCIRRLRDLAGTYRSMHSLECVTAFTL